ncbi:Alpha/Beta hydrolase protein [Chaetomidium leptoderma]|uniref:Alpha/Beta hydrolase protein n=1 Tax=Chaetomidium leptoderma TaxID=669021 RepID=A0AAN6VWP8_9PEZI|nr:Alpha/Beta hydrolase protein [Chaetomidium leptoderma]
MATPQDVDKLTPTDPRMKHCTYTIPTNNKTYHYLLCEPPTPTPVTATCLLIHGFPDLSLGWRYQVPYLLSLGLRVIVPDLPGFGRTDAPKELEAYSFKAVVDDFVVLVRHVLGEGEDHEGERIVLGGHDWGGAVAWRFAMWYPELLRAVFSVCTPFWPASEHYLTKQELVKLLPTFGYQVQFEGTEVEEAVVGREKIRAFLSVMYGASREDGQAVFGVAKGVRIDLLEADKIGESPLLNKEEMEYYADEYVKNGMRGPLCWYKTGRVNFDEERKLLGEGKNKVTVPALMVTASRDAALPPAMAAGMDQYCVDLVKRGVDASHWALWEAPADVNKHIGEFLEGILKGQPLKASI